MRCLHGVFKIFMYITLMAPGSYYCILKFEHVLFMADQKSIMHDSPLLHFCSCGCLDLQLLEVIPGNCCSPLCT